MVRRHRPKRYLGDSRDTSALAAWPAVEDTQQGGRRRNKLYVPWMTMNCTRIIMPKPLWPLDGTR
jgi:hypothetical protein